MAYLVKTVEVYGFQHNRDIKVPLRPDVNFIIGRNGTGKTSFIRLLHACLSLDLEELSQIQFAHIEIAFQDTRRHTTPVLRVERASRDYFNIKFKTRRTEKFTQYFADGEDSARQNGRIYQRNIIAGLLERRESGDSDFQPLATLRKNLRRDLQFSWLPLLRSRYYNSRRNEFYVPEQVEEPINRKIKELTSQITTYLSVLDTRVSEANNKFQREIFISYLDKGLWDVAALNRLDVTKERQLLVQMFQEMEYPTSDILEKLDTFFEGAKGTRNRLLDRSNLLPDDIANIVSTNALHRIVTAFDNYTDIKANILFPRTRFIRILNELLYRKTVYFDEGNVLTVKVTGDPTVTIDNSPDELSLYSLSSGERQLLIILSETLLQQQRRYVFIADEPELSLHVEWQEKLVPTIRDINENAQIIFATHSPDVVSMYQDNVIDFEKI